jgi:serine/threonine-protein kinase
MVLAAAGAGAIAWYSAREPASASRPVRRFSFQPTVAASDLDLSPDGTALAYTAGLSSVNRLYVRPLDELDATLLSDTEGARIPFFSPDGEWIAFVADDKLKKIRKSGGPAITLCDVGVLLQGAWGPNGQIVVAERERGLLTVSEEGGPLVRLTTPDAGEIDHHAPSFLPGGEAILFTIHVGPELFRIAVRSLVTGEQRTIIDDGYYARYAASGHLVYGRDGGLYATRFDADQLRPDGAAVLAVERVETFPTDGVASFSIASDGTLVYVPAPPIEGRTLVWVDRSGREEPLPLPPRGYGYPALSPDGKRLAVQISEGPTINVWLHDLASGALQPLTHGESDTRPVWAGNGDALTYASRQPDGRHIVLQPLASAVPRSLLVSPNDVWPGAWTPDNRLLFVEDPPTSISKILQWRDGIPAQPEPLLAGPPMAPHTPTVSPDGQWLMYTIFQRGIRQVVVRPMTGGTSRQITADGGVQPRWTRNGTEIVFRHRGRFMSVPIRTAARFEAGPPQELFADTYVLWPQASWGPPNYDVTADGTRFLVVKPAEGERTAPPLHFVDNWFQELNRRVPARP